MRLGKLLRRKLPLSLTIAFALTTGFSGAVACAAQEASSLVTPRIVQRIDESNLVTLKGSMHPLANARNDRGAAPESMQLERMHLVLTRSASQETSLRQLVNDLHTPGTASYHKWLTPDQFGKQFGPSDQDITAVETWLTQHGFSVTKVNPGKQTIEFSGNVAQMRSAFHTQIHKYEVDGETHYANAGDPQIPAAIAPVVGGFVSLNNFKMKSSARVLGKASYNPKTDKAIPAWTHGTSDAVNYVLSPGDYAVQYDLTPLYNANLKGTNQSIAIIDYSNINIALANQFRTLFGLPPNPPQVIIDGNDPGIEAGASIESYLDVEWAGAVAPNATIYLVVAADTQLESGGFLAAERAVYGNVAPILSSSIYQFGCEQQAGSSNAFIASLWEQAAAQGITVLEASGDSGSAGCDSDSQPYAVNGLGVNNWASTPFNVAVGGTDFYYSDYNSGSTALNAQIATYWDPSPTQLPAVSLLQPIPEQPWNDSQFGLDAFSVYQVDQTTTIAGGSGGASNCATGTGSGSSGGWATCTAGYTKPSWQSAATGIGVPNDGVRDIPDLSLYAADGTNYSFYPICASDGDCQSPSGTDLVQISGVGGTSAAAPSFAGIMALVNQKYGPQGLANYVLYPLKSQFPAAFHDVTNGTNSMPCETGTTSCIAAPAGNTINLNGIIEGQLGTGTTADYNAAAGYNLATGLGTVDASLLVNNWNKVTFTSTTTTLAASPTSFVHGTAITVSGNVTSASGTPAGDVALLASSTEPVQQGQTFFTLNAGAYTGPVNFLPGGSYKIWGQYGGDGKNGMSTSTPVAVTVSPEASGVFFNIFNTQNGQLSVVPSGTTNIPYGTQLTLSAMAAPSSQLTAFENCETNGGSCPSFTFPTGTVSFSDTGTALSTAVINAEGDAEYTIPTAFNAGSHSITASYSGDQSYNPSTTTSATKFTIVQSPPTVLITSPQTTYSQGQTTTLTVLVEGYAFGAAPTGTVTITGGPSGTPPSATLSAGVDPIYGVTVGLATVTIPATASAGTYNIKASYTPTGASVTNYGSATSSTYPLVITGAAGIATTTTGIASAAATSPAAAVVVSGTVTAASGAAPTGTVYILLGILNSGSGGATAEEGELAAVTLVPGTGKVSTFGLSVNSQQLVQGANQLTLQYSGNATDASSTALVTISNPLSDFSMVPQTTIVTVPSGSNATDTINLGSSNGFSGAVNLTCTPAAGVTCTITPTAASLISGSSTPATLTVSAGASTPNNSYNVLITGTDSTGKNVHTLGIQTVVSGSTAPAQSFTLSASPATLSLTPGATTGNTSTVTVTPINSFTGAVGLSCTVTGPSGATDPAACAIAPTVSISGAAPQPTTLTITTAADTTVGSYTATVTGVGGGVTTTTAVTINVAAAAPADFEFPNTVGTITVTPGAITGNTSTITVTPLNGFTGSVALTCSIAPAAASDPATCSFGATSPVTISGAAAQATLTVKTTAATSALSKPKNLFWPSAGGIALALLVFFGIPARKRNWPALLGLLVLFVSIGAIGCGGGSSGGGGGGGGGGNAGTTPGTYTVTVTGTSGSLTHMTTVTLTVQ